MEKTAMQELKDKVLDLRFDAGINGLEEFKNACNQVINRIEPLLEKERQQIIDAAECQTEKTGMTGKQYYNETFNQHIG